MSISFPTRRLTFFHLLRLALPLLAGNLLIATTGFISVMLLSKFYADSLYLFALFLPIQFFLLAVQEAWRATASALVATYCKSIFLPMRIWVLLGVSVIFSLLLLMLWVLLGDRLLALLPVSVMGRKLSLLCVAMFVANIFAVLNGIVNASLASIGLVGRAFFCNILLSFCMLSAICVLAHNRVPLLYTYIYAFSLSHVFVFLWAIVFLCRRLSVFFYIFLYDLHDLLQSALEVWHFFKKIALPVFASWLVILWGVNMLNNLLANGGSILLAGFGLVYRLQMIVYQPALAIGVAMAILINQAGATVLTHLGNRILLSGMLCSAVFYVLLALGLFFARIGLANVLTSVVSIQHVINDCLYYLAPSWACMGPLLALLMLFEQTGYAFSVLCLNFGYFVLLGVAGYILIVSGESPIILFRLMAYANCVALLVGGRFFFIMKYKEKSYVRSVPID